MSTVKDYRLELTDFEEVALEKKLKQRDIEIAKKLFLKKMPQEEILEVTGLSTEEVSEIIKSMPQE
ncbi:MAG: hypothetical protein U0457_10785 [Candidatus Sericytochromatia bacterium]